MLTHECLELLCLGEDLRNGCFLSQQVLSNLAHGLNITGCHSGVALDQHRQFDVKHSDIEGNGEIESFQTAIEQGRDVNLYFFHHKR